MTRSDPLRARPAPDRKPRRPMRFLGTGVTIAIFVLAGFASAQPDGLKTKLLTRLGTIVQAADGVVGIAIKDLKTGDQILIDENEIFPQASAIKIHILAELYRQAEQGKFKLTDVLPLPASARVGGSGVLNELGASSVSMSIRDYAVLMIVLSDNTATNHLIQIVGLENVNKCLEAAGASKTRLQRVMMDVKAAAEGRENVGTPKEVMMILEKLYKGELLSKSSTNDMLAIMRIPKEGPIRAGLPPSVQLADKEGDIEGVRCNVGIVYLPGAPYVICVMTKLLLHDEDGAGIITEVSRLTYQYFEREANSNQYGRRIPR